LQNEEEYVPRSRSRKEEPEEEHYESVKKKAPEPEKKVNYEEAVSSIEEEVNYQLNENNPEFAKKLVEKNKKLLKANDYKYFIFIIEEYLSKNKTSDPEPEEEEEDIYITSKRKVPDPEPEGEEDTWVWTEGGEEVNEAFFEDLENQIYDLLDANKPRRAARLLEKNKDSLTEKQYMILFNEIEE
jgi:hypothetical protein